MRAPQQPAAVVAGLTPLVVGALLVSAVLASAVAGVAGVMRGDGQLGWLLFHLALGTLPMAVGTGLAVAGWSAVGRGHVVPAIAGATAIGLAAIAAGANSQWLQPDLDFLTDTCGVERCLVHLGTAGLPGWNAQRGVALAVGLCAAVSLVAGIARLRGARSRLGTAVVAAVLAAAVGSASLAHADRSARRTRQSCARYLAYVEGSLPNGPGHPTPTADMVERCRDPARHATSEG
jgi:hypothetical protein